MRAHCAQIKQGLGRLGSLAVIFTVLACAESAGDPEPPRSFASAESAIEALIDEMSTDNKQGLVEIFGAQYENALVTSDWDADRPGRERIVAAAKEKLEKNPIEDGRVEWILGSDDWPFPFQTVRADDGLWRFDTEQGLQALIDRRIGRNELSAIAIMNAYVDAQIEYAKEDRDGDDVLEYAQRLTSTEGTRDGLYWESDPGEPESPFGPLVRGAETYLDQVAPGDPIRGYYFRVLDRQGANPPGGAYDYRINGHMIAGFALVAYPAEYGNTGVMTFVVNHRGEIQQKAIENFEGMDAYDPDDSWALVEDPDAAP